MTEDEINQKLHHIELINLKLIYGLYEKFRKLAYKIIEEELPKIEYLLEIKRERERLNLNIQTNDKICVIGFGICNYFADFLTTLIIHKDCSEEMATAIYKAVCDKDE